MINDLQSLFLIIRIAGMGRLTIAQHYLHPHVVLMTSWKPKPREPAKTKAELREMLAEAVRNTQPQTEPKPKPKAKKDRG